VGFLLTLAFLIAAVFTYPETQRDYAEVAAAGEAYIGLQKLMATLQEAEISQRDYMVTGDEKDLAAYQAAQGKFQSAFDTVHKKISNTSEREKVAELRNDFATRMNDL